MKHIVGFVDFILNKQVTHLHFFHSYVLFKIKLGLYEGLALLPWFGTEKLHPRSYAARLTRDYIRYTDYGH